MFFQDVNYCCSQHALINLPVTIFNLNELGLGSGLCKMLSLLGVVVAALVTLGSLIAWLWKRAVTQAEARRAAQVGHLHSKCMQQACWYMGGWSMLLYRVQQNGT